jgi:hypothetical protein
MAHRLAPGAEVELDEIWLWTAKESGSVDIADRFIDSISSQSAPLWGRLQPWTLI